MKFAECNLIVDEREITNLNLFSNINDERYNFEGVEFVINGEIINNKIFWLYIRYGKAKPYSKEVLNIKTKEFGENPKHQDQVELKNQLFCAYVLSEKILYMSDFRKHKFLSMYLKDKFKKDFVIKKYFIDAESFVSEIKFIENIKFVAKKNIFNQDGIFSDVENAFGYGSVASLEFKAKMENKGFFNRQKCLELIRVFRQRKDNGEISKMQCIGRDDDRVEKIFNLETYVKKIEIAIQQDENGMFSDSQVKRLFLKKISKESEC